MGSEILHFMRRAAHDARTTSTSTSPASLDAHLLAALEWIERAHDRTGRQGVSYGYSLRGGWKPPYRETSGYIVSTLFRAADALHQPRYHERAVEIARWLVSVQNTDGSISNPKYGERGIVFDTGQVLFGLVRAHQRTGDDVFLQAGVRAARWLVDVADEQGRWTRSEHLDTPHVYNARTAWALVLLDQLAPDPRNEEVARANLDWARDDQTPAGFFRHAAFVAGDVPYTHNLSYTTCGLQESGWLLGDDRYVEAGRRCAAAARNLLADDGFLPGQIDADGRSTVRYACLTGNAQFAVVWAKWFDLTGDPAWRDASERSLRYVMRHQDLDDREPGIRGAIAGSFPIWGRYAPMSFPNWATKFFIDAALLQRAWSRVDA